MKATQSRTGLEKGLSLAFNLPAVQAYQEMVYCSGSNSTSHMKTKGFCFQLPLINIRRESAKMKFKIVAKLSACHLAALGERGLESCTLRCS